MTCCGLWSLAVHLLLSIFGVSGVVVVVHSWSTLRPPALCHHMLSLYFIPGRCSPHLHIQCWTEHRFLFFFLSRLWLCTFTLSVAVCAVLLLPISILSNEVLLTFPHSYYMQWLNGSLIHGNNQCSHTRHPIQRSSRLQRMSLCL